MLEKSLSAGRDYINDLLLSIQDTDICDYAGDTTIYACDNNLDNVIARLENNSNPLSNASLITL